MIIDIIPCVVVTSLETDAFMVIVAYFMVRGNPARGREEGTQGSVAFLNERKKRPRLCVSKLRSNEFYSTESWRIGIERFGETHLKFPGCIWHETKIRERKRQSGGIIQKGELHERNLCALGFEEQPREETSRQADCTSKVAWSLARKYASSKPKITTFYSPVKAPETQNIVWLLWIRELRCTMLSKGDSSSDTIDTLKGSKTP